MGAGLTPWERSYRPGKFRFLYCAGWDGGTDMRRGEMRENNKSACEGGPAPEAVALSECQMTGVEWREEEVFIKVNDPYYAMLSYYMEIYLHLLSFLRRGWFTSHNVSMFSATSKHTVPVSTDDMTLSELNTPITLLAHC